jgi:WD40 repeat protein
MRIIGTISGHNSFITHIVFSPGDRFMVSCDLDRKAKIWKIINGKFSEIKEIQFNSTINSVAFNTSKNILAFGTGDPGNHGRNCIHFWRWWYTDEFYFWKKTEFPKSVHCIATNSDGKYMAISLWTNQIKIYKWANNDYTEFQSFHAHESPIYCLSFNPDGNILAAGTFDSTVNIWDLHEEEFNYLQSLNCPDNSINDLITMESYWRLGVPEPDWLKFGK